MKWQWFGLIPCIASAGCLPVTGDRLLGRDLAGADPVFAGLPAALQVGFTPIPGSQRHFTGEELRRIASVNGLRAPSVSEACFEFPIHIPTDSEFRAAMQRSLPPEASVRIVEMHSAPVPVGRIEFSLPALEVAVDKDGTQMWRGYVQYTESRRVSVWARVAVTQLYTAIVTQRDLAPGDLIDSASVQLEKKIGFLRRKPAPDSIESVTGRALLRAIKAGTELRASDLIDPPVVKRGDSVRVEVHSGSALIRFNAIVENTVRAGEIADLRNPLNGGILRVRLGNGPTAVIVVGKAPSL